jgi:hypothetical protein
MGHLLVEQDVRCVLLVQLEELFDALERLGNGEIVLSLRHNHRGWLFGGKLRLDCG